MKPFLKYSFCLAASMALIACSSTAPQQAGSDFSYLETEPLRQWQALPENAPQTSNTYAIPRGNFQGVVGENVNILPPAQLLELIPAGRYKTSPYQAIFMLPNSEAASELSHLVSELTKDGSIPVQSSSNDKGIETQWIKLDDKSEGVEARFQVKSVAQSGQRGVQITLLEVRNAGQKYEPNDAERERYNVFLANKILLRFDSHLREKVRQVAQKQALDIPIELGTDSNANPVIIARSSYDEFWDRLPSILEPLGFSIDDRNRSQGTLSLSFSAPDEKSVQQLGIAPLNLSNRKYQLQLGDLGNRTSINILDNAGKPISDSELTSLSTAISAAVEYLYLKN